MRKIIYILIIAISLLLINNVNAYTEYKIGEIVPYNGIKFYVIKDSSSDEDTVTMLKADPLTGEEISAYAPEGVGTNSKNGYTGMQYHASSNKYSTSFIKTTVDAWVAANISSGLVEARLITFDELNNNLGYDFIDNVSSQIWRSTEQTPIWVYKGNYWYWTESIYNDSESKVYGVDSYGTLNEHSVSEGDNSGYSTMVRGAIRPVITLKKTALGDVDESIIDSVPDNKENEINNNNNNKTNESKTTVKVDNTYMSSSILLIILGFIIASVSVLIIYKLSNKKK